MKKLLLLLSVITSQIISAQNVGIATLSPQATLDVRGNHRFGGLTRYMTYDSITGRIEWKNSYILL